MFEKEAEEFERRKHYRYEDNDYCGDIADGIIQAYQQGAEFGFNKANEQLTLPKDILSLWQQTVCEIRSEIKSWDLKWPHVSDYAKVLCDKLARSMCAVAGAPYCMRYSITD